MPRKKSWLDAEIADHLQLGTAFDAQGDQPLAGWLRVAAGDREPA